MTLPPVIRIDWFRVIVDLERAGWSHRRIGRACDMHRLSVLRLKSGAMDEPKHTPARLLLALWCKALDRTADTIPCEWPKADVRNLDQQPRDTSPVSTPDKERPHGQGSHAERPDSWRPTERAVCAG